MMLGMPETLSKMTLLQVMADNRMGCISVIELLVLLHSLGY